MSTTPVLAPVAGRAVPLQDVPDPVFAQGMVGYGAAIDPPRGVSRRGRSGQRQAPEVDAARLHRDDPGQRGRSGPPRVWTPSQLNGEGFTAHVSQGDEVTAGQVVITYDVPSVEAKGLNPIVPVVVMDEREPGNVIPSDAVTAGAEIASGASLFTATK